MPGGILQYGANASRKAIAWGVASRALPAETETGDMLLLKPVAGGLLLSVVDGLGHGPEAAAAARTAIATLEEHAEEPLPMLVHRCHRALIRTRGVTMTLAMLEPLEGRLTWLGVGDVEGMLFRSRDPTTGFLRAPCRRAMLLSGVVGYRLPSLCSDTLDLRVGDLLIFTTDGIGARFTEDVATGSHPQQIADRILEQHFKGSDDALVLVLSYIGAARE